MGGTHAHVHMYIWGGQRSTEATDDVGCIGAWRPHGKKEVASMWGLWRLKRDKPISTRIGRGRVCPEDLGKPLSPSKATRKGQLGQHSYQAGLTVIGSRTSCGLDLTAAVPQQGPCTSFFPKKHRGFVLLQENQLRPIPLVLERRSE